MLTHYMSKNKALRSDKYTFIFGNLAEIGTDGVPYLLFYFAGTMLWTYFTGTLNSASSVFTSNSGLFGKIYFPRLTVPISTTVGHIIKLGIQFACLLVFYKSNKITFIFLIYLL